MYYLTILTLHIMFSGIWLINFLTEPIFRKQILINKNKNGQKKLIRLYLLLQNLIGMIGAIGIMLTGIFLVINSGSYGFFQFTANHWLTTKQIILVIILVLIGIGIIPNAKKVQSAIGNDLESTSDLNEVGNNALNKIYFFLKTINILVLINFILALTHRFIG